MFAAKNVPSNHRPSHNLSEIAIKSGFKFRDIENRQLDWKTLGCVDVNRVIEHQDYDFLQKIIPKIIEAPMQTILSSSVLDPAVSSLFRLAQLSLQYLSFCQQFMDHTLYDLRTAFNHLHRKNTSLRHNYKRLEEEHYKAKEKIHLMQGQSKRSSLVENDDMSPPRSEPHPPAITSAPLFACEHCTKNFLSEELLRAHIIRKHDDNGGQEQQHEKLQTELKQLKEKMNAAEKEIFHINSTNNNNANGIPMTTTEPVCTVCFKKSEMATTSSVAIQCDDTRTNAESEANLQPADNVSVEIVDGEKIETNEMLALKNEIQIASKNDNQEQTIADLKAEVAELQNALRKKFVEEQMANERETTIVDNASTSDKIDVIQQRITEFEMMYVQSQHQFIESFRNLDERQKTYMNDIQDTIKEIVEKSLGRYGTPVATENVTTTSETTPPPPPPPPSPPAEAAAAVPTLVQIQVLGSGTNDTGDASNIHSDEPIKANGSELHLRVDDDDDDDDDETSESLSSADDISVNKTPIELRKSSPKAVKRPKSSIRRPSKADAVNEFENRLHQIGVDLNVSGLSTPQTAEVAKELAEERAEIKKAHKTFATARNKLNTEVERIAKAKLTSASSVTSLSSHRSDDDVTSNDSGKGKRRKNVRPKSAKRDTGNVLRKFVSNDIDESDLMGKMKMAQKAIDAHRECIQELLQTTTHSPNPLTPTAPISASKHSINTTKESTTQDDETNRYNKMPNVTTRRVVFVNLDEDS